MADFHTTLVTEIKAVIQATWPEMTDNKFFSSVEALRINLLAEAEQAGRDPQGSRTPPPYAVLQVGQSAQDLTYGLKGDNYRTPVTVYFLGLTGTHIESTVRAKLWALKEAIESAAPTAFQVIEEGIVDSSDTNNVNAVLLSDTRVNMIGGTLRYEPGLLS